METTQQTPPASPEFIKAYRMGFAVTAVDMAERMGLVSYLNTHLRWDPKPCRVSPGTRLLALMLTFLVDSRALYRLPEFYAERDCAVLFGADRQPADFNDDAIGRALEKLFEAQAGPIHTGLCKQAVERLGLGDSPSLHGDTTTVTLTGQYPNPGPGSQPAYGYNKDGHPECKPWVVGLVTRTDGLPYTVDVCDGHRDDPTWSRQAVVHTGAALAEDVRDRLLFVADSQWVSQNTVEDLCEWGIRLVSRLPHTFKLAETTKTQAHRRDQWEVVGVLSDQNDAASYKICELPGTIRDQAVRLIVVHSSALAAKADHDETKTLQAGATRIDASLKALMARTFACQADAEAAWTRWPFPSMAATDGVANRRAGGHAHTGGVCGLRRDAPLADRGHSGRTRHGLSDRGTRATQHVHSGVQRNAPVGA